MKKAAQFVGRPVARLAWGTPTPRRQSESPSAAVTGSRAGIVLVALLLFVAAAGAQTYSYELVHAFGAFGQPEANVIRGADGYLYGTTRLGGANSVGSIFRMSTSGAFSTVHSFSYADGAFPQAALVQGTDGNFYGTTTGGQSNAGTVFLMDPAGNFTTIHVFSGPDGTSPQGALVQGSSGSFYGTTYAGGANNNGTVFKVDASGNFTTLYSFNGVNPMAALVQGSDGYFYGTTSGSAFKIDDSGSFTSIAALAWSAAALIVASDGNFYGTTEYGGFAGDTCPSGCGTVFKMDPSGNVTTLHLFSDGDKAPAAALLQASDGNFYGTTSGGYAGYGTVYKIDASGGFTTLYTFIGGSDGRKPLASLIQAADGMLYGTTSASPYDTGGTVFRMDTSGNLLTLHSFDTGEGLDPKAGLVQATDGKFYGTTNCCVAGAGTLFSLDAAGNFTTLHTFNGNDGTGQLASLIQGSDGNLYGVTYGGGVTGGDCPPYGCGTVYKIDASGNLTTLHFFKGPDGSNPRGSLVQGADGSYYGTTTGGGLTGGVCYTFGCGTVFKMDAAGNLTTLHAFNGLDEGSGPYAGLVQATDGKFYGTTSSGRTPAGDPLGGTVFRIDSSGSFATLHIFSDGADGLAPLGDLVQAIDGNFYGTTGAGANADCYQGCGTVFKMDSSGNVTTLVYFNGDNGGRPQVGLTLGSDGGLYGTTLVGGATPYGGQGTVFRVTTAGDFALLHSFGTEGVVDGWGPYSKVIQASDGDIYGTAAGGPGLGVVFRITSCPALPSMSVTKCLTANATGQTASVSGNPSDTYLWTVSGGTVTSGQGTPAITFTAGDAGTRMEIEVFESGSGECVGATAESLQVDFADVPPADLFHAYVCAVGRDGITAGCGGGNFCRNGLVTRAQMAVFLLKAEHGSDYEPPSCVGVFADVPCPAGFAVDWVEQLAFEGVTAGCGGGNYCPGFPVTRAQMAPLLVRTKHGNSYAPPACAGIFDDVACPSPFADWIEELSAEGVTGGCNASPPLYCPANYVTRGQMAVFLVKTFNLQ